jgi:hypothetical protein
VTYRILGLIWLLFWLPSASKTVEGQKPQAESAFDYTANVGIAVAKTGSSCLEIGNAKLTSGQRLRFIVTAMPQTSGEIEITQKLKRICDEETHEPQREPELAHYQFRVVAGTVPKSVPFVVLANFHGHLTSGPIVTADLDGNGQREFFRSCNSSEGVHLTIWAGKPLEGTRRWHGYYALGYDVDADCTEADTQTDKTSNRP